VRVVTDSAARLDPEWARAHGVTVLPQTVVIDGKRYREDLDISSAELDSLARVAASPILVEAPHQDEFFQAYRALADQKADVVTLHISSAMSDTLRRSVVAKDDVSGRCAVHLVETRTIGLGLNALVRKSVALAESGMPAAGVVTQLRRLMQSVYGIFVSDDMAHLQASGRLRPAQAKLGAMLGITPALTMEEGRLVAVEKVRSPERAIEKLSEFALEFEADAEYAIMQIAPGPTPRSNALVDSLAQSLPNAKQIPILSAGADIGSIIGPRGLGIMIVEHDDA
jgi:DegV family protein with EDD domain